MRTTSLRWRVIALVLAAVAVVLLAVGLFLEVTLQAQLRNDLQQRLLDRAGYAQILAAQGLPPQDLANQLTGDDVTVTYRVSDTTVYGRPVAPRPAAKKAKPAPPPPPTDAVISENGDQVTVTQPLAGGTLTLGASRAGIDQALSRLRTLEAAAAAAALLILAALLTIVVTRALQPLSRMTDLAVGITRGGRGGRLRPTNPRTELGRTAAAFDDMLGALEAAESVARRAAADARIAEEQMRRLLGDVSHELRTPIAGIQATAETLLRNNPPRAARERLAVDVVRETHRAARLVDDLLLITRLDSGGAGQLDRHPVDFAELIATVADEYRRRTTDVQFEAHTEPAMWVHGDQQRLRQILGNLLDNAGHATPTGGLIRMTAAHDGPDVRLDVADTGPGVEVADRERIFQRFVRLDTARSRAAGGGAGLGLSIARALAEAHGGTLRYSGTTNGRFTLHLPRTTP